MPTSPEEREAAQSALRLADKATDLAFAQAVWRMASRPAAATPEAREIDARLQTALKTLAADKATVDRLTAAEAKASLIEAPRLKDQLELAKAIATLDQDAVDDAQQDLMSAGGNPQSGFDEMIRQHEAASQSSDTLRIATVPLVTKPGLVSHVLAWQSLHDKRLALVRAEASADSTATVLRQRHDSIQARAARRLKPRTTAQSRQTPPPRCSPRRAGRRFARNRSPHSIAESRIRSSWPARLLHGRRSSAARSCPRSIVRCAASWHCY